MNLKTRRLLLRPFQESDAADLYEYAKDPRVGPIAGWPVHTSVENSREIIRTVFAAPNTFAVAERETGKVIGSAGFTGRSRVEFPAPNDELGYALSPAFWGRGLMPEAAEEILTRRTSSIRWAATVTPVGPRGSPMTKILAAKPSSSTSTVHRMAAATRLRLRRRTAFR